MKKLEIIILMFAILLLSGCTLNYNIEFKNDQSIKENFDATAPDTFFNKYAYSSRNDIIDRMIELRIDQVKQLNYEYEIIDNGVKFKNQYKDIGEYLNTNNNYQQFFEKLSYTNDDGIISIKSTGKFKIYEEQNPKRYGIDKANISIKTPFEVIETNADKIDKKKGIYIWTINKNTTDKSIVFVMNSKKNVMLYTNILNIGIITIIIAVTLLFIIIKVRNNYRNINKI